MKNVEMYSVDDKVMVEMIVDDIYIKEQKIWYTLRDPMTNKIYDNHSFSSDMLFPVVKKSADKTKKVEAR